MSAAGAGPPRAADLRRAGRGGRAARSRGRCAGRRAAHGDGGAAGEGGAPAADHVRPAGHAGRSRPRAAPGCPCRRAGLHGAVRAGSQRARGHAGRDRLARRRRTPLAMGIHHPGHDGLRDLPRPRVRRRGHGAGDRLRRRARARRVGAVSLLRRAAPDVSESLAPTLQAPPGGLSRQSLGRRGAGGPAGRPRPAGPLQRGRAERARDGHSPRPPQRPPRSADRRTAAARRRRALRGAPGQRVPGRVPLLVGPLARLSTVIQISPGVVIENSPTPL